MFFTSTTTGCMAALVLAAWLTAAGQSADERIGMTIHVPADRGSRGSTEAIPETAWLTVPDAQGAYTLPYIQSGRDLLVRIKFDEPAAAEETVVSLLPPTGRSLSRVVNPLQAVARFDGLAPGEYSLGVVARDAAGATQWAQRLQRIGVGTVLAALGDSLTEGYHGHGFKRDLDDLRATDFPPAAVSRDGRNFPQFSPTTAWHKPEVNCFQSWMTRLNDRLAAAWQQPVFIANEGWGGYTTGHYLALMRGNGGGWRDRMRLLAPNGWLIHLGVNDERQGVAPETFAANLRAIVDILRSEYRAAANSIFIARPSYDYAPKAEAVLRAYIAEIDRLVAELGLCHGPDFFAAFATDRARWYGADPVHPGPEGIERMADLWSDVLTSRAPVADFAAHGRTADAPQKACRFVSALQAGRQQTLVTYGTSLTAGGAWVPALADALEQRFPGLVRVINAGMGAMNSDWGIEHVDERVVAKAPDAVFIEFSVNDAYLPYNPELTRCEANLRGMIRRILDVHPACKIILMIMNPMVDIHAGRRPELERFNDVYRRVARDADLCLIDHYPVWQAVLEHSRPDFDLLVPDGAHPGELGCRRIVTPGILRALGLSEPASEPQAGKDPAP